MRHLTWGGLYLVFYDIQEQKYYSRDKENISNGVYQKVRTTSFEQTQIYEILFFCTV